MGIGLMTKNNRLDCIDFIENNMEAKVRNRLDGFTTLKRLTDDYLDLQLTTAVRVEMKLLPVTDSTACICMVRTCNGPVPESDVTFYSASWERLASAALLPTPDYAAFWVPGDMADAAEVARLQHLQDMRFVTVALSPDNLTLAYTLQPGEVNPEEAERMKSVLRPVTYHWQDGRFVEQH